jgi:hypothetical protein
MATKNGTGRGQVGVTLHHPPMAPITILSRKILRL